MPTTLKPAADRSAPAADRQSGFTLIELLVVMLIIGVLVAIATPMILRQRGAAVDSSMRADLKTVAIHAESYLAETGDYPTVEGSGSLTIGTTEVALSPGNHLSVISPARSGAPGTFCILATRVDGASPGNQTAWVFASDRGGLQPAGTTSCD